MEDDKKADISAIRMYFAKLGLENEIADIYFALHAHGPQTMSELARNSGVERTRLYRLIDSLQDSGLIELESQYKRGIIRPAPISNLRILISKREQELQGLQDELELIEQVFGRNSLSSPATRVQFYHGPSGLKQMQWNQTKAKSECCSILYENMQIRTDSKFFERWAETCNARDIHFRGIVSKRFIASQNTWYKGVVRERLKHWKYRIMDEDTYPITHSTMVYDDVVMYLNWKDDEVFGIEIYNKQIADSQRAVFEMLWEHHSREPEKGLSAAAG